jgi:hypothetical protein
MPGEAALLLRRIRAAVACFAAGLILSGLTAFPLSHELDLLAAWLGADAAAAPGTLRAWIALVQRGLSTTGREFPFLAYGTDWLAYGHLAIAVFFIGSWRDPVRNIWVLRAGLIACAGVIPLALICGAIRGIPVYWRLLDCSFGIVGAIPAGLALQWTHRLEALAGKRCGS